MRLVPYIVLLLLTVAGCSRTTINSWSCDESAGSFRIPKGWKRTFPKYTRTSNSLELVTQNDGENVSMSLDVFCKFDAGYPETQEGCAQSYLDGTHDVWDDEVRFEEVDTISHPLYGPIKIYRFFSDWFGDHLVAKVIVPQRGYASVELWAKSAEERARYHSDFFGLIRSLDLQNIRRSKSGNKKTTNKFKNNSNGQS